MHVGLRRILLIEVLGGIMNRDHHHTTTILQPLFRDHPGELVPEENFWTL